MTSDKKHSTITIPNQDGEPIAYVRLTAYEDLLAEAKQLATFYEPHADCKDSEFDCDYRASADAKLCPCATVKEFKDSDKESGK